MTTKTKVYISGPMSGLPEHNFPAFFAAEKIIAAKGYDVVNPAEEDQKGKAWRDCLALDIKKLVDCDVIAMLPGHENSRGAQLERYIAVALGMTVKLVEDFE